MDIAEFKDIFVPYLNMAWKEKQLQYQSYIKDPDILDMIGYVSKLMGGGKCIRPFMAYLMFQGLGGKEQDQVMELLVGLEVFHTFALIHDDVIDKGDRRHNIPTLHKYITENLIAQNRWSRDMDHEGNSQAILVGDLLFAWSMERFSHSNQLRYHADAWKYFIQMIDEVAIGQMVDVDIMTRNQVSNDLIETKMKLKTAGYTFVKPMQIGVTLAGREKDLVGFCQEFGEALGLAFQTQDDLLDLMADPDVIKKTVLSDIRDHQHTYLTQHVFEHGTKDQINALQSVWGKDVSEIDRLKIQEIFIHSGAVDVVEKKIIEYLDQAKHICDSQADLPQQVRESLLKLVSYIEHRSY